MTRRYWNIRLEELLAARVHIGHAIKKWNPRMAPYIFISPKHKDNHITNLTRTARFLAEACHLVFYAASIGKTFLIVDGVRLPLLKVIFKTFGIIISSGKNNLKGSLSPTQFK